MAQAARKSQFNTWAVSGICRQKTGGGPCILGAVVRFERGAQPVALRALSITAQPRQEVAPC